MTTKVSTKGQVVIPEAIREQARLRVSDSLDVGYANGLIVMRKRRALGAQEARALILSGKDLPEQSPQDEAEVARAIQTVRRRRS